MSSLVHRLARYVPSRIRRRGTELAVLSNVEIVEADETRVEAEVEGGSRYAVSLAYDQGTQALSYTCACRYFHDRVRPCKHVWAALVICDRDGELAAVRDQRIGRFEPDGARRATDQGSASGTRAAASESVQSPRAPGWQRMLSAVESGHAGRSQIREEPWPDSREILYRLDGVSTGRLDKIEIHLHHRQRKKEGVWSVPRSWSPRQSQLDNLPEIEDHALLSMLAGVGHHDFSSYGWSTSALPARLSLPAGLEQEWLRRAAASGRLVTWRNKATNLTPLTWDDEPWRFTLEMVPAEGGWVLDGRLAQAAEQREVSALRAVSAKGTLLFETALGRIESTATLPWLEGCRGRDRIVVPAADAEAFVAKTAPIAPPDLLRLPESLRFDDVEGEPRPQARFLESSGGWRQSAIQAVELHFDYGPFVLERNDPATATFDRATSTLIRRNRRAESEAEARLRALGVRDEGRYGRSSPGGLIAAAGRVRDIATLLAEEGWTVFFDGARLRSGGDLSLAFTSEIDWFDLSANIRFGDATADLPALLEALESGRGDVRLDDGTRGLLQPAWQERLTRVLGFGTLDQGRLRFATEQLALVDALLVAEPEIDVDAELVRARERLAGFSRIEPRKAPRSFHGHLRGYQEEGLGWMRFLRDHALGGCLADDMGLGKTVQVLAHLAWVRAHVARKEGDPTISLVVVPRSLLGNWAAEAARFAPRLEVHTHHGSGRVKRFEDLGAVDVVLTTYGTMRRDIGWLVTGMFHYVVLDEAQAIKNYKSATAKAARLLRANHRLTLSGTPVENHVGELLSLFDFLNPGLFTITRFGKSRAAIERIRDPDDPTLRLVARAVRPFILRRRKEDVARDLPPKLEETLSCELTPKHRREYQELRDYYRSQLDQRIAQRGFGRSKILVLEALLRLRQAACHPGLLDKTRRDESSAKLDLLLDRLDEIAESGHKALVFSQFTTFLAILRRRLEARGVDYAYLDGRTRNRERPIAHFRESDCPLFLISLKAGGLGLNLTEASYVFLLDPWWNPAVEAQAIDRTHRIGQEQSVFAYRVIAQDTVEEKVVQLQQSKQALADALITADRSMLRDLTRDDLERLLS